MSPMPGWRSARAIPMGWGFRWQGRFALIPWLDGHRAQAFLALRDGSGGPAVADPRGGLEAIVARYAARGLTPVVAVELEFYLYRLEDGVPVPPDGAHAAGLRASARSASWRRNDTLSNRHAGRTHRA